MSSKRQRVTVEMPSAGAAALPAVCYLPSVPEPGDAVKASQTESDGGPLKHMKFKIHSKHHLGSSIQMVHASLGDIDYIGRSDGFENRGLQTCYYALGVYQPGDKKLQLVKVAGDRIFRLEPRLAGLVYEPTGAGVDPNTLEGGKKAAARKLVSEFGSTRRRRQMDAREAGMVTAEKISGGAALHGILTSMATRTRETGLSKEEVTRRAFSQRTIPPHNPSATTAAGAYPLELLLSRNPNPGAEDKSSKPSLVGELNAAQMHRLVDDEQELQKARENKWVHPYVLKKLGNLRRLKNGDSLQDQAKARERAKQLSLLTVLLRLLARPLLNRKGDGVSNIARELHVFEGLAEFFLERFYELTEDPVRGVRYERSSAQRQLLISYILAVVMVAEDGFLDALQFEELRDALQMDSAQLVTCLRELGCESKSVKATIERNGEARAAQGYQISLLRQTGHTQKTLEQCFPAIKLLTKSKGR
ncbi:hypothetical protein Vretimale_18617 [Volvox reticuliferus]|uniref:Uncharacterized protein n=1 Tax=Volvox reticuliferus TaxID=1737510 RepID=A0A8J4GY79_9CHLO|nr:hypothetical protein Vretifemale_19630 [Volvox reticuliferus]GIM15886.1 hypothetical protein Vretimale_18617 [Volvox reticuliferus]